MREDNLLDLRRRAFVSTTDSTHDRCVYPNLVPGLNVTSINQRWGSDLTYIRLTREWVYLAVILDACSRRCIGWALDRTLDARLTLAARAAQEGLVHHADRGVMYASKAYVDTLKNEGIRISMSRRGNPYDNAKAERFIRTLKYEKVYLYEYASLEETRSRIGYFIDKLMQSQALALGLGLQAPGRVRADDDTCQDRSLTTCPIMGCTMNLSP